VAANSFCPFPCRGAALSLPLATPADESTFFTKLLFNGKTEKGRRRSRNLHRVAATKGWKTANRSAVASL